MEAGLESDGPLGAARNRAAAEDGNVFGIENEANDEPFGMLKNSERDGDILSQKNDRGLLLNLTDNFKQNGSDLSPTNDHRHLTGKPNGNRPASADFDDSDFGPETDVDAPLSPIPAGRFGDVNEKPSSPTRAGRFDGDVIDELPAGRFDGDVIDEPLAGRLVGDVTDEPLAGRFVGDVIDEGVYNPFVEHQEKAALEMERHLRKFEGNDGVGKEEEDLEVRRMAREETPTPPADAVHDVSGLDNAAESDSEDEWNYIKGEEANKENEPLQPEKKVAEIPEEDDNMSQLNPNAAEFVPVSPTRSIPSPSSCRLMNDLVLAQSPKRPMNIDIKVPRKADFDREVKSRPSDVESYSNGHNDDDDRTTPTDLMESILNGKNIDDIPEFQPGSTPKKGTFSDEFHFGPNAAPFTPIKSLDQSETVLSTKAIFGDESLATLGTSFNESTAQELVTPEENADLKVLNKESDPMSMSFYAHTKDTNPFDLNKVQVLPDDLDEFLQQPDIQPLQQPDNERLLDDTISDLPEYDPSIGLSLNNDDAIQTTDLDKQAYDNEKELASPLEPEKEFTDSEKDPLESEKDLSEAENEIELQHNKQELVQVHREPFDLENEEDLGIGIEEPDFAKTPEPTHENLLGNEFCHVGKPHVSESDALPRDVELINPEAGPETDNLATDVELISPESIPEPDTIPAEVELITESKPEESENEHMLSNSVPSDVQIISPEPQAYELGGHVGQPEATEVNDLLGEPEATEVTGQLGAPAASEVDDLLQANLPESEDISPIAPCERVPSPDFTGPELLDDAQKHFEELCHPSDDLKLPESPQEEVTTSVKDDDSSPVDEIQDSFVASSPVQEPQVSSPKDTESIATTDVNSFLDRSLPPEVESPLSPGDFDKTKCVSDNEASNPMSQQELTEYLNHPLSRCVFPLPPQYRNEDGEVKSDVIAPDFADQTVVATSEESKQDDTVVAENAPSLLAEPVASDPPVESSAPPVESSAPPVESSASPVELSAPPVELSAPPVESSEELVGDSTAVGVASAVAAGAAIAAVATAAVHEEKKKPSSAASKRPPAAATKNGAPATAAKLSARAPAAAKAGASRAGVSPKVAPARPGSAKPSTTTTAAPKTAAPKPIAKPRPAAASKPAEKKPLANGDVKPPVRSALTAKKVPSESTTALKTSTSARLAATASTKLSPTKPAPAKPAAPRSAARPATASGATAAPRTAARPATLTGSRAAGGTSPGKSVPAATRAPISRSAATTATAAPRPKPAAPAAAPLKARAPPAARPAARAAPDAEKQSKESANKVTAAARSGNVAGRTATSARSAATGVRRVESKTSSTRTITSKTTTTTMKSTMAKKPTEIVRTKTTKIEKPKQNGTSETVIEEITMISDQLLKDNSPVDNKLITESILVQSNAD